MDKKALKRFFNYEISSLGIKLKILLQREHLRVFDAWCSKEKKDLSSIRRTHLQEEDLYRSSIQKTMRSNGGWVLYNSKQIDVFYTQKTLNRSAIEKRPSVRFLQGNIIFCVFYRRKSSEMFYVEKIPSLCFLYGNFIFYIFYGRKSFEIFSAEKSPLEVLLQREVFMLTDRRNLNCLLMTEDRNSIDSRVSNCERRLVFFKQRSSAEITFFKVSIKRSLFQVSIKRRLFRVFDREKNFKRSAVGRHFKRIIK